MLPAELLRQSRIESVAQSLREDIGEGDITARLIPADKQASGRVITREPAVVAGRAWVDEVFRQVDPAVRLDWRVNDGDRVEANQVLFTLGGFGAQPAHRRTDRPELVANTVRRRHPLR